MIVAEYVAKFCQEKGIKHAFGYQGGAIAKIIHEIVETGEIEYVQNYHEQASSFAACAYGKIKKDVALVLATSGPGAINIIAGIADAFCDSVPVLFITGQDSSVNFFKENGARLNGFQDLDIAAVVRPITKYSKTVKSTAEIVYELEKCYEICKSGRPGPVLLDIPVDIQLQKIAPELLEKKSEKKDEKIAEKNIAKENINNAIELIKNAKKPVILCGGGVRMSNSENELAQFIATTKIPVVATSNAIDIHENLLGFSGLYGNSEANLAILNADLLLVFGSRLGQQQVGKNLSDYTKAEKIIHVDIDKIELGRVTENALNIEANLKNFLQILNEKIAKEKLPDLKNWHDEIAVFVEKYHDNPACNDNSDPVKILRQIQSYFANDAIITFDVGQNQMWASQAIKAQKKQRVVSGVGYGSMGCSLPYSIGASFASGDPKRQIICINGDGGFQMNMQELMLISDKKLNVKIIVLNNSGLGLIKDVQNKYMENKYYGTNADYLKCPDLNYIAKAYDFEYLKISDFAEINNCEKLIKNTYPCLIEITLDSDAKILNRNEDYKAIFKK